MRSISVQLPHTSYEIRVGAGLIDRLHEQLVASDLRDPFFLVSQPRILKAIGPRFKRTFAVTSIPDGERAKSFSTVNRLIGRMMKANLTRQSTVVAVGGGVVGDVAAFVASIYMRGVPVVLVPTTLLAQVDSSIGGKTAVNYRAVKNLVGTFYQPRLVISDPAVLRTLPEREYTSGLYEAIKYGIISNPELFREFENGMEPLLSRNVTAVEDLVAGCAAIKARVIIADEKESDLRRILNFGHTVGHALESAGKYQRIKHGEAVGYGMIAAARISTAVGKLPDAERIRIENAVRGIGRLPKLAGIHAKNVFSALQHDKKTRDGAIHFVLLRAIGKVEITPDVPIGIVRDVVKGLLDESKGSR
jgi:3-dehydroquinate synthase